MGFGLVIGGIAFAFLEFDSFPGQFNHQLMADHPSLYSRLLSPEPSPTISPREWIELATGRPPAGQTDLHITVTQEEFRIAYSLSVPLTDPVFIAFQRGEASDDPISAVHDLLPTVMYDGSRPRIQAPTVRMARTRGVMEFEGGFRPPSETNQHRLSIDPPRLEYHGKKLTPRVTIDVSISNLRIAGVNGLTPVRQTASHVQFRSSDKEFLPTTTIMLAQPAIPSPRTKPVSLSEFLHGLDSRSTWFDPLRFGLLGALPLLYLIMIRRRLPEPRAPTEVGLFLVVPTLLAFHFSAFVAVSLLNGIRSFEIRLNGGLSSLGDIGLILLIAFLALVFPLLVRADERRVDPHRGRSWPIGLMLAWVVAAFPLIAVWRLAPLIASHDTVDHLSLLKAASIIVGLTAAGAATILRITVGRFYVGTSLLTGLFLLDLSLLHEVRYFRGAMPAIVRIGVTMTVLIIGTQALARISWVAIFKARLQTRFSHRWQRVLLLLAAATIAWPYLHEARYIGPVGDWSNVFSATFALRTALAYIVLVALVRELRALSPHLWTDADQATRARLLAIAFALVAFYNTSTYVGLPLSFLAGAVLVHYWLLPSGKVAAVSAWAEARRQKGHRLEAVTGIIAMRRTLQSLRKTMLSRLSRGDITLVESQAKIDPVVQGLASMRADGANSWADCPVDQCGLELGADQSAWNSGKRGAVWGLTLSIPWIFVGLVTALKGPGPNGEYGHLLLITKLPLDLFRWTIFGFFFGYFFPLLRGRTGMRKGLALFVALAAPTLLLNVFIAPIGLGSWGTVAFNLSELFIHSLLLGLVVGDLATLRSADLGWRELVVSNNLQTIAAWASSLGVAIGAAVTAFATSRATDLLVKLYDKVPALPRGNVPHG